jgi:hypothetical protein
LLRFGDELVSLSCWIITIPKAFMHEGYFETRINASLSTRSGCRFCICFPDNTIGVLLSSLLKREPERFIQRGGNQGCAIGIADSTISLEEIRWFAVVQTFFLRMYRSRLLSIELAKYFASNTALRTQELSSGQASQ